MRGLEGRSVIVTGAASGIGRATCARLLEEGVAVTGFDIAEAAGAGDPGEHPVPGDQRAPESSSWAYRIVDVTDEDAISAAVSEHVARLGSVHGLVHAAGVAGGGPAHLLDRTEWQRVIDVNLTGTFLMTKHVITAMLAGARIGGAQRGSIVTISSIEGIEGTAGGSSYNAAKGGVVLFTKNLAIDYAATGIRVNTICPGFIDTPMTQSIFSIPGMEEPRREIAAEHKLGRYGRPEEIAAAACFLLSADASFITGHAVVVDGGYTAGRDHGVTKLFGLDGA
jgi:NAD(P)-dependent dehydrogenase (short-subunit alcohol dehydrogenase family)